MVQGITLLELSMHMTTNLNGGILSHMGHVAPSEIN